MGYILTICSALQISDGVGAWYGPLIFHIPPASVHRKIVDTIKVTIKTKPMRPARYLRFKPTEGLTQF